MRWRHTHLPTYPLTPPPLPTSPLYSKAGPYEPFWYLEASSRAKETFGSVYSSSLNTGVLFFQNTSAALAFAEAWMEVLKYVCYDTPSHLI